MRVAVGLLLLVGVSAGAQQAPYPMLSAINQSMQRVCAVDKNSRQCELLQELFADQLAITRGEKPDLRPVASATEKAEFRAALRKTLNEPTDRR